MKDLDKAYDALQPRRRSWGIRLAAGRSSSLRTATWTAPASLISDAQNVRGCRRRRTRRSRAIADYNRAKELYQAVAPYGHATRSAAVVQTGLEAANARLAQIAAGRGGGH